MTVPHRLTPARRRALGIMLGLVAAVSVAPRRILAAPYTGRRRTMVVTIHSGPRRHRFTVELALTPRERSQGLMYRSRLAADGGMLFLYRESRVIEMWMKNTRIPLDMIFIDREGRIARIHHRAVPGSLETISSGTPVRAVLEVAGGTAARLGIRPGDRVVYGAR